MRLHASLLLALLFVAVVLCSRACFCAGSFRAPNAIDPREYPTTRAPALGNPCSRRTAQGTPQVERPKNNSFWREYGRIGVARWEWYVGDVNDANERHGWGILLATQSGVLQRNASGWWQNNSLAWAGPVPFAGLCRSQSFFMLLNVPPIKLTLSRAHDLESGQVSESITLPSTLDDDSVALIWSAQELIPGSDHPFALYRGDVEQTVNAKRPVALRPHGRGNWTVPGRSQPLLAGTFLHGLLEGSGEIEVPSGSVFQSDNFVRGVASGNGTGRWTWLHDNFRTYAGSLNGSVPHGEGELLGSLMRFRGSMVNGKQHGWGRLIQVHTSAGPSVGVKFSTGSSARTAKPPIASVFAGWWQNGTRHGEGSQRRHDGSEYVGQFRLDEEHGLGRRIEADGTVHDGEWEHGEPRGFGVQLTADGDVGSSGVWMGEKLVRLSPVPIASLTDALSSSLSLPPNVQLLQRSPTGAGFALYRGEVQRMPTRSGSGPNKVVPHGQGEWLLDTLTVWESTSASFCTRQDLRLTFPSELSGRYEAGLLEGMATRFYPNGDAVCGHFIHGALNGMAVLLRANAPPDCIHMHEGHAADGSWHEQDCWAVHPVLPSLPRRARTRGPHSALPLFDISLPHAGWLRVHNELELTEVRRANPFDALCFTVTWERPTGRLLSSAHSFSMEAPITNRSVCQYAFTLSGDGVGAVLTTISFHARTVFTELSPPVLVLRPDLRSGATSTSHLPALLDASDAPIPILLLESLEFLSTAHAQSSQLLKAAPKNNPACRYLYYRGQLNESLVWPHGRGVWFCADGRVHESGRYEHGLLSGYGTRVLSADGERWEGMFEQNVPHGLGVHFVPMDGQRYEGPFAHGRRDTGDSSFSTAALLSSSDGTVCTGSWQSGVMHGLNSCKRANGSELTVNWRQGQVEGFGVLWTSHGQVERLGWFANGRWLPACSDDFETSVPIASLQNSFWLKQRWQEQKLEPHQMSDFKLLARSHRVPLSFRVYRGEACDWTDPVSRCERLQPCGWGVWLELDQIADNSVLASLHLLGAAYDWSVVLAMWALLYCCQVAVLFACCWLDSRNNFLAYARNWFRLYWYGSSLPLCEWLYLCYGRHGLPSDTAHRVLVYRSMRRTEAAEVVRLGIRASDPLAKRTKEEHVRDGSKQGYRDQFISATADWAVARQWAGVFRQIAILRAPSDAVDLSTRAAQGQHLRRPSDPSDAGFLRQSRHAHRAVEVLIERKVEAKDVAVCELQQCKVAMQWPTDEHLNAICAAVADLDARAHYQPMLDYQQLRQELFPLLAAGPMLDIANGWRVHGNIGRFVHVERLALADELEGPSRHYLAFCGAPNLHWTSTPALATTRQLVVQCQTEVISHLLYRLLLPPDQLAAFPPCALFLCELTHGVPFTDVSGRTVHTQLPDAHERDGPTPLLLYKFHPNRMAFPAAGGDASSDADDVPPAIAPAVLELFSRHWVFDALLLNFSPNQQVFAEMNGDVPGQLLRYGLHNCLVSREDALRDFMPERLVSADTPDLLSTLMQYLHPQLPYEQACSDLLFAAELLQSAVVALRQTELVWQQLLVALQKCRSLEAERNQLQLAAASNPKPVPLLQDLPTLDIVMVFRARVAQLQHVVDALDRLPEHATFADLLVIVRSSMLRQ